MFPHQSISPCDSLDTRAVWDFEKVKQETLSINLSNSTNLSHIFFFSPQIFPKQTYCVWTSETKWKFFCFRLMAQNHLQWSIELFFRHKMQTASIVVIHFHLSNFRSSNSCQQKRPRRLIYGNNVETNNQIHLLCLKACEELFFLFGRRNF